MEKLMMSDLRPQSLIALDNGIWPDADYLALALIIENNGNSIKVLPVHNDEAQAGENDAIIASVDSGLDFAIVVVGRAPVSLPSSAFAGNSRQLSKKVFKWVLSERHNAYSKYSGIGMELINGSSRNLWRNGFLAAFADFRFICWRNELLKAGRQRAESCELPALNNLAAVINKIADEDRLMENNRARGPLVDKSLKLIDFSAANNRLKAAAVNLAEELGLDPQRLSAIKKLALSDIFELLVELLKP